MNEPLDRSRFKEPTVIRYRTLVAVLVLFAAACIPKPQPIDDERKSYDRSGFQEYILSSPPAGLAYPNKAVFGKKT